MKFIDEHMHELLIERPKNLTLESLEGEFIGSLLESNRFGMLRCIGVETSKDGYRLIVINSDGLILSLLLQSGLTKINERK